MRDKLERLYREGKLTDEGLHNAVNKGWIMEEEYQQIITQERFDTLYAEKHPVEE